MAVAAAVMADNPDHKALPPAKQQHSRPALQRDKPAISVMFPTRQNADVLEEELPQLKDPLAPVVNSAPHDWYLRSYRPGTDARSLLEEIEQNGLENKIPAMNLLDLAEHATWSDDD